MLDLLWTCCFVFSKVCVYCWFVLYICLFGILYMLYIGYLNHPNQSEPIRTIRINWINWIRLRSSATSRGTPVRRQTQSGMRLNRINWFDACKFAAIVPFREFYSRGVGTLRVRYLSQTTKYTKYTNCISPPDLPFLNFMIFCKNPKNILMFFERFGKSIAFSVSAVASSLFFL